MHTHPHPTKRYLRAIKKNGPVQNSNIYMSDWFYKNIPKQLKFLFNCLKDSLRLRPSKASTNP